MLDLLNEYVGRVKAGEILSLGIVAATSSHCPCAYVVPTDDSDPAIPRLFESIGSLTNALKPAHCGTCGGVHRGLICHVGS